MTDPTPAQLRALRHVMRFQAEHVFSPSIRNLVDVLGLATVKVTK